MWYIFFSSIFIMIDMGPLIHYHFFHLIIRIVLHCHIAKMCIFSTFRSIVIFPFLNSISASSGGAFPHPLPSFLPSLYPHFLCLEYLSSCAADTVVSFTFCFSYIGVADDLCSLFISFFARPSFPPPSVSPSLPSGDPRRSPSSARSRGCW